MPGSFLNPKTGRVETVAPSEVFSPLEGAIGSLFPPRLPPKPDLGPRFRPTPYERESLDDAMARMNEPIDLAPPAVSSTPAAPTTDGSGEGRDLMDRVTLHAPRSEYEADVPGFLARGSSPEIGQMADAFGVRREIDENIFSGRRPDLLAAERGRLAIGGLRNARQREAQQLDPNFAREQASLDQISGAETFMNPALMAQRQQQQRETESAARGMQDIDIGGKTDPRVLGLLFQQWLQQQQLAQINASGRNPFGELLRGANVGAAPGRSQQLMSTAQVRQDVISQGGSEADVEETIADLRSRGITVR